MTPNEPPPDTKVTPQRLIAKIELPAKAVGLATVLDELSTIAIEGEQLVPNWNDQLPYLWVTSCDHTTFEEAVADDPSVVTLREVATFDSGNLYEVEWAEPEQSLRAWLRQAEIPILKAEAFGETQSWQLKLRIISRNQLTNLQEYCEEQDVAFELLRLYSLDAPKMGQYNVSPKQREAMLTAYQMGYFEIPRGCKLRDVAEELDIASRSVSERIRRGELNLLTNTLLIGHAETTNS